MHDQAPRYAHLREPTLNRLRRNAQPFNAALGLTRGDATGSITPSEPGLPQGAIAVNIGVDGTVPLAFQAFQRGSSGASFGSG
jgi:hypothetical protein